MIFPFIICINIYIELYPQKVIISVAHGGLENRGTVAYKAPTHGSSKFGTWNGH